MQSGITARQSLLVLLALGCALPAAGAQLPGSLIADRARLSEITGDTGLLARSRERNLLHALPSSDRLATSGAGLYLITPEIRLVYNSGLPYSLNDGPLWAGRGWSASVGAGFEFTMPFRASTLTLQVAPSIQYSQNEPFQIFPSTIPGRSVFANPFHGPEASLDLPHRFGNRYLLDIDAGRTTFSVAARDVEVGITSGPAWWGPGIRNALVLSNNGPGIPRLYVRSARPVRTAIGAIDAELIAGALTQSRFFSDTGPRHRTLSGVRVQLTPAFDSTLTVGVARVVYAPVGRFASTLGTTISRAADALVRWEYLDRVDQDTDQLLSLFARWTFPGSGFEVYGEWARMDLPKSAAELLVAGHHSAGYTLGLQYARPRPRNAWLRLQAEISYLEQSRVFDDRVTVDFYSGMASPQGYTQRGQAIGASIGPGASSQWIALDWIARSWQVGAFVGRIRWDNDAMYRQHPPTLWKHDVSILSGLRGAWRAGLTDVTADLTVARRYNWLFQNGLANPGFYRTVDVDNVTLSLHVTPR